jgi:hypothetical protein
LPLDERARTRVEFSLIQEDIARLEREASARLDASQRIRSSLGATGDLDDAASALDPRRRSRSLAPAFPSFRTTAGSSAGSRARSAGGSCSSPASTTNGASTPRRSGW